MLEPFKITIALSPIGGNVQTVFIIWAAIVGILFYIWEHCVNVRKKCGNEVVNFSLKKRTNPSSKKEHN